MIQRAVSAEFYAIRHRPVAYVIGAVWTIQILGFAYLVSFLVLQSSQDTMATEDRRQFLDALLPNGFASFAVNSLPIYGGPVLLILGIVLGGSDHRFGTLRTLLPRFPDRRSLLLGRWMVVTVVTFLLSLLTLVLGAVASSVVAAIRSESVVWPSLPAILTGLGAIWLIMTAFTTLGFALGVITRSLPVAIAVGLLWTPGVESLLSGLAGSLSFLRPLKSALLSPTAGSLAGSVAQSQGLSTGGAPGVSVLMDAPWSVLVLLAYIVIPLAVSVTVFSRRDVL